MAFLFQGGEIGEQDDIADKSNHQDLLVFGYQCKLFRDDTRAASIDAGDHLIPWMGDETLKIDRYDGRGHLFDLKPYDADYKQGWGELSPEEVRIERLCEEERYLELHTDLAEKAIQEEEELKRLNQELAESDGYTAVGFSYDEAPDSGADSNLTAADEEEKLIKEEDEEFIPPPELSLPKSMIYPQGTSENAIIEKTAKFVASHGGQMEIMIKTKQANNSQFNFLNFEHSLNPYYKHQVYMIKSGRYNPDIHNKPSSKSAMYPGHTNDDDDDDDDDGGYLHPSLLAKSSNAPTSTSFFPPQLTASQLEDTSYGRILKKLADKNPSLTNSPHRSSTPTYSDTDSNQGNYLYHQQSGYSATADQVANAAYYYSTGQYNNTGYYNQDQLSSGGDTTYDRPASPPADVRPLIERLLSYIIKDGEEFEKKVLQSGDDRFSFLNKESPYYQYFVWRKNEILSKIANWSSKNKAVSFSIKQKESETASVTTTKKAALPVDPESDDDSGHNNRSSTNTQSDVQTGVNIVMPISISPSPATTVSPAKVSKPKTVSAVSDEESLQKKIAEQKLRDKLAAAMREKMTQVTANTKEKSLQAERKRKAAMFVNMLKSKRKDTISSVPIGPQLPPKSTDSREDSPDRLSSRPLVQDYNHGRPKSPSNPHKHNRNRDQDHHSSKRSRRDDRHSDRYRDDRRRDADRYRDDRHRDADRRRDDRHRDADRRHRHRRQQRSPSIPKTGTLSELTTSQLSQSNKTSLRNTTVEDNTPSPTPSPFTANTESSKHEEQTHDNEYLAKVRKMLKASRREVYKEDLFGD